MNEQVEAGAEADQQSPSGAQARDAGAEREGQGGEPAPLSNVTERAMLLAGE